MYWARALADQTQDAELRARFGRVAAELEGNEAKIVGELNGVQGKPVQVGGYYHPDPAQVTRAMRPSATLNAIIDGI
jgi:isocitrate dehydrogenase